MELLIVDDEKSALEAVREGVCWENLHFSVVHLASNIMEAKRIMAEHRIQILLCDIEMPGGSGLELLEWVNGQGMEVCCIFMTCHADFTFAQRALHLGSFEYILKPLDFRKLEEVLGEAVRRMETRERSSWVEEHGEESRKAMVQQFWRSLFVGELATDEESLRSYITMKRLDISLTGRFFPVLISPSGMPDERPGERKLYGFALRNVCAEIFSELGDKLELEALAENRILVVLTINGEDSEREIHDKIGECCGRLIRAVARYFHIRICCYVGDSGTISEIPEQLEDLWEMDLSNIVDNSFVLFRNLPQAFLTDEYERADYILEICGRYPDDYGRIFEEVAGMVRERKEAVNDGYFIYHFFAGISYILYLFSQKHNVFLKNVIDMDRNARLLDCASKSLENLLKWLGFVKECIISYENQNHSARTLPEEIKGYINTHLDTELSAETVARWAHLNADYLNRVFKKSSGGISLNRYIVQQKMERAKWLLKHTDWQIGEVAAAVGYYNYSSFYRSFNKLVGMSPLEYKET